MTILTVFEVVFGELRSHRVRSVLAGFSIVVGVATLTIIVALGDVARSAATDIVERQVGRPATLRVGTEGSLERFASETVPKLERRLERYGASEWSRELIWFASSTYGGRTSPGSVIGVDPGLSTVRRVDVDEGRWLIEGDERLLAPVLVVNVVWREEFGAARVLGGTVHLALASTETDARIVGVVDDGQRESRVYAPATVLARQTNLVGLAAGAVLVRTEPSAAEFLAARLRSDLRSAGAQDTNIVRVDAAEDYAALFTMLQLVLSAIAAVSLVSGGLGILNLGLVTARQRARDFAIRRSFGATSGDIFGLVMAETVAITLAGGLLGVVAGGLLAVAVGEFVGPLIGLTEHPPAPFAAAIVGLVVSFLIGILAGLPPARLAMRVSIIEAIRS
jgi:putative ABC transport system permease protein